MTATDIAGAGTYRTKQIEVQAFQLLDHLVCVAQVADWINSNGGECCMPQRPRLGHLLTIVTREGTSCAGDRWWIIQDVRGEFHACGPDIFALICEPVIGTEDDPVSQAYRLAREATKKKRVAEAEFDKMAEQVRVETSRRLRRSLFRRRTSRGDDL